MTVSGRGRARKYCSAACKQRAYEQRNNLGNTNIPAEAVIITPAEAEALRDRLYEVRCAAEDLRTAIDEGSGVDELLSLADELVQLTSSAERLRIR